MITENELQISNMSYTEKDFQSIYPALLTLARQLTNRWDPASSNESDPGNVLLKLAAVIGDKTNYNIDKNVLECFLPSATQETSMRMLTEALGYNMKYYQSAVVDILFKYTGELQDGQTLTLPRFSTVITNSDKTVFYTLIDHDVKIALSNFSISGRAIEGSLSSLLVGNNEIIKLENLDDNNRLYFPETMVAQNGVFITNNGQANFEEWKLVDNLNTQRPLTRCYKFGFDSLRGLPYIEFPSDVAELIGSGILVSYIVTKGVNGNVTTGMLTELAGYPDDTFQGLSEENLVIYNASASTSGAEKETIDEAYTNFKKTIGTFDTLITTRDYANAIYNLVDEYNNPMVSNASVADRTTDFNHALNVVSYDKVGQYTDFVPSDGMGVADLSLYPLKPYQKQNYNVYSPSYAYNESFKPLKEQVTDTTESDDESSTVYTDSVDLVTDLDEMKCIGHSFRDIRGNEVCLFKTVATLDVQIFTYAKVNIIEQAEIRNNVLRALSDNFNARELEYGYEIPYDSILDVIYAADNRIKSVSLAEPNYEVQYVTPDEEEGTPVANTDVMTEVIAKNVLAGKLQLFRYDDRFEWSFGQTEIETYDGVQSITTDLRIYVEPEDSGGYLDEYVVDKNETIQLVAPSLSTKLIYPTGVYYQFTGGNDAVVANSNYLLVGSDQLDIKYTSSAGEQVATTWKAGTIIRPSFGLERTSDWTKIDTDQQIEVREKVEVNLQQSGTPIYWVRNNANNILFNENQTNVLLDSGEYFIYSNPTQDDLVILGAGTSITRKGTQVDLSQWSIPNPLSLENISLNGLSAFTAGDWQFMQFTTNNFVTVEQMQIVTLSEGTTVRTGEISGVGTEGTSRYIDGAFREVTETISDTDGVYVQYKYGDEDWVSLENAINGSWNIRTRLDVVCGPDAPQTLFANEAKKQTIYLTWPGQVDADTPTSIEGTSDGQDILCNFSVDVAGGTNISMLVTNLLTGTSSYSASFATYVKKDVYEEQITPTYHEYVPGTQELLDPLATINVSLDVDKRVVLPINIERFETAEPTQEEMEQGFGPNYDYKPYATYIVPLLVSLDPAATSPTTLTLSSDPEGALDLYRYNSNIYTMLTSEPADWDTNWTSYFTHDDLYGYQPVESVVNSSTQEWEAPEWEANKYYRYDGQAPLTQITQSGLYNLEIVAGWLGEYEYYDNDQEDASKSLVLSRPEYLELTLTTQPEDWPTGYYTKSDDTYTPVAAGTTFSAGTYYVKPNTTGDICRVLTADENDHPAGLYKWSGSTWVSIGAVGDCTLIIESEKGTGVNVAETLSIGRIHKIDGLSYAISSAADQGDVLHAIDDLTAGAKNSDNADVTFYYTYTPDNSAVIEVENMSTAEAFWDVNNVVNKFTISQINLDDSNIVIARSSQA